MNETLGLDGKLHRNTGTVLAPTWTAIDNVKNLRMPLKKTETDVSRRAAGKERQTAAVLLEAEIQFEMVHDLADANVVAIRTAFRDGTSIELAVADGPMDVDGTEYFRAHCTVLDFSRNEDLENAMERTVAIKPTPGQKRAFYGTVVSGPLVTETPDYLVTESGETLIHA